MSDSADAFCVVNFHPLLVQYVDSLQRKNAESLSFYPRACFEREHKNGRLFLGLLNDDPCGYIYVGSASDGVMRCHQVCIQYDARRRLYGAALVSEVEHRAIRSGASTVRLRCGFDLDANKFWKDIGYSCVNVVDGGVRRMRKINVWEKRVAPELFAMVEVEPAVGKTDATLWRKNKQIGVVTQFVRGQAMKDYRALLVTKSEANDVAS